MPRNISKRLEAQRRLIAEDVEEIGDRAKVAKKWECSISYINQCCRQFAIDIRTNLSYKQIVAIVADLLKPDMTYRQIETKHKIGRNPLKDINHFCKLAGLDTGRKIGRPRK